MAITIQTIDTVGTGTVASFLSTLNTDVARINNNFSAIVAPSAIDTDNLADGAVTAAKIHGNTITSGQIAQDAITTSKMSFPTVTSGSWSGDDAEEWRKFIGKLMYPVGSYYWSSDPTDPQTIFGGTWVPITDRFLYAVPSTESPNATGGTSQVKLTVNQMPEHDHLIRGIHWYINHSVVRHSTSQDYSDIRGVTNRTTTSSDRTFDSSSHTYLTGGAQAHENMPPYITAYCWRRVSLA